MDIEAKLSSELGVEKWQVTAAVQLIDEDNTIPFIARYRKEKTGALNDEVLRKLYERLIYLRNLEDKKQQVIATIRDQGKMTDALLKQIEEAQTQVVVDDLYRPYRPKRRTRAMIAKEKGLEKLAAAVMAQNLGHPVEEEAADYVSEEKGVADVKEALEGASDILAESIADTAAYRMWIRQQFEKEGRLVSEAKDDKEKSVYEMYYHFAEPVSKIAGHRVLAINRAEKEKMVNVTIEVPEEKLVGWLKRQVVHQKNPYTTEMMEAAAEDSYRRLIAPAVEREVRNALTEKAEEGAMTVFGKNLQQLLMQPPIKGQTVLGWDPAFRTGCKLAVVDPTGKVLDTVVIYPTEPQKKIDQAK
ncbi:MAG: Tex-like N-terminal domain-containing protein, partial [Coprococcus sp.]